jgi:hypothetical protein
MSKMEMEDGLPEELLADPRVGRRGPISTQSRDQSSHPATGFALSRAEIRIRGAMWISSPLTPRGKQEKNGGVDPI